ncbi:MAG: prepilin-type N-terminal cleavage/methylation domain-containing protein [Desulfatiglans sp.]|jgi:prepilin-type N-terminal cleavage/methylation domain-containing protein|nr:prepilin-type N-terminal cleavage/methylation domain-containing protein [Desulfatiglans sp.]
MMNNKRLKNHQGFTMVELVVAVALSGVVMAGTYMAYQSQHRSYRTQVEVSAMQHNVRIAHMVIERDVRMAGSQVDPSEAFEIGTINMDMNGDGDLDDTEDTIDTNNDPNHGGADAVFVRYSEGGVPITDYNGAAKNVWFCTPSGIEDGDVLLLISADGSQYRTIEATAISETGVATAECPGGQDRVNFSPGLSPINSPLGLSQDYIGGMAFKSIQHCYFINTDCDGDGDTEDPCLMMTENFTNPQIVVEGIEDLQIVYTMDDDSETTAPANIEDIRGVRITTLARTTKQFPSFSGRRPLIEDHPAGGPDRFRRKPLAGSVKVRNLF